ncbi:hypothetical protein ACIRRA_38480 [Nocardia sp. NPDC101769]|uniref:hypothetical protein n=1 Tax=Nocardia sp. NPDC101769 TaxID=3364333 RepID=UPI0038113945
MRIDRNSDGTGLSARAANSVGQRTQPMIDRLPTTDPARWFGLPVTVAAGSSDVLVTGAIVESTLTCHPC